MSAIQRTGATLVALAMGMAACVVATPTPSSSPSAAATAAASGSPAATASSSPTPAGFAAELDIHSFPRELSGTTLEFVSDGSAIVYSSSRAPDSGPKGAPDLWRYEPGAAEPTLMWRNPERDNAIVKIAGDLGTVAFVDIPLTGERAWNLWLVPEPGADAILLDRHPGDPDVSSLVPSIAVYQPLVAWSAFDAGPNGPVSQLLVARAPDWTPQVVAERPAAQAELWLPSLYGSELAYTQVVYAPDRLSDERHVFVQNLADPTSTPRRLDRSGRATMPLVLGDAVFWKEADPGFNMFNWGTMFRYDLLTDEVAPISVAPQDQVNYPSIGSRFIAWWGRDAFKFSVYDTELGRVRLIASYSAASQDNVLRPHVAGDLLVWLYVDAATTDAMSSELRWAYLPIAGGSRFDE